MTRKQPPLLQGQLVTPVPLIIWRVADERLTPPRLNSQALPTVIAGPSQ